MRKILYFTLLTFLLIGGCRKSGSSQNKPKEIILFHQLRTKIQTLDPANIGDVPSDAVGSEIFECLYRYHYLKRPYQIVPELAVDMPTVSTDRLVYTIPIRKDIYFHDDKCFPDGKGRNVKAKDFIYSWKRLADIKTVSKMWWILDNKIVGLDEFRQYSKTCKSAKDVDYNRSVEGLQAPDDYTLVIKLKRPWPQIMLNLAYSATAVVAKEAVDYYGKEIGSHPVGTGPFMLETWHRGSYIEVVRHPHYRFDPYPSEGAQGDKEKGLLVDAGKPMPFVNKIIWRVVDEDLPRWLMFKQGDIDITSIPKDNFGQAMASLAEMTPDMKQRNIKFESFAEPDCFFIDFNMENEIVGKNKPLRLAVSYCLDRKKYIELFLNGRGQIAYGFIPPIMPSYDPDVKKYSHSFYDLQKAKAYLKQAEEIYGGPLPPLKLQIGGTDTTYRQMGQFLKSNMEAIGLDVELDILDWPTHLERLRTKNYQICMAGWMADWPDAENFLQIFYSKNSPWPNHTNYNNPAFDKIYEQVKVMDDSPERTALYRKAERIIIEDAPSAFMYHRTWYTMYHDWVSNLKPDAYKSETAGFGLSKYYRIDPEKRNAYKAKYK